MEIKESLKGQTAVSLSLLTTLGSGAVVLLVGKSIGRGLFLLSQVMLARILGPEWFGLYAIGWTFFRMLGIVVPLGLDQAVVRYGSVYMDGQPEKYKGILNHSLLMACLSGLLVSAGLYLLSPYIASVFQKPDLLPVLRWFAVTLVFFSGIRVIVSATTLSQRMIYAVTVDEFVWPGLSLFFMIIFLQKGWGVNGTAVAVLIALVATFIVALIFWIRLFPVTVLKTVQAVSSKWELLSFSLPAMLAFAAGVYLFWIDRLMIGYWLPADQVGIYQAVSQFSLIFATILASMNGILTPMIARFIHQKRMKDLETVMRVATKWGLYVSLPLALVIWVIPEDAIQVILGEEYKAGILVAIILVTTQLVNVATGAVNHVLIMASHQRRWLILSTLALGVNVGLNWLLIPRLGIVGAALATAVSIGGLFVAGLWQMSRLLGIWPYDRRFLKGLAAFLCALVAVLLTQYLFDFAPLTNLVVVLMTSFTTFIFVFFLIGLDVEDWEMLKVAQTIAKGMQLRETE